MIFDHVPKCAGSSVSVYLEANYAARDVFNIRENCREEFLMLPQRERNRYRLIKGHLARNLFDSVHRDTLKVTLIRDPVARVISHYHYVRTMPIHYLYEVVVGGGLSIEEYFEMDPGQEVSNFYTRYFSGFSGADILRNPDAAVEVAVKNLLHGYDVLGLVERLDLFEAQLKGKAGLVGSLQPIKVNVTGRKPKTESQKVLNKAAEINVLDIEVYSSVKRHLGLE
jgi:hypothetical protein